MLHRMDVVLIEQGQRINVVSPGRVGLHRRPRGLARPDEPLGVNIIAVFGCIEVTVMLPLADASL
jgi:hypothetical protein